MKKKQEYQKAEMIEDIIYVCSICDDEPESCFECEEDLPEDKKFYCDGFGQHLCPKCYKKQKEKKCLK